MTTDVHTDASVSDVSTNTDPDEERLTEELCRYLDLVLNTDWSLNHEHQRPIHQECQDRPEGGYR